MWVPSKKELHVYFAVEIDMDILRTYSISSNKTAKKKKIPRIRFGFKWSSQFPTDSWLYEFEHEHVLLTLTTA